MCVNSLPAVKSFPHGRKDRNQSWHNPKSGFRTMSFSRPQRNTLTVSIHAMSHEAPAGQQLKTIEQTEMKSTDSTLQDEASFPSSPAENPPSSSLQTSQCTWSGVHHCCQANSEALYLHLHLSLFPPFVLFSSLYKKRVRRRAAVKDTQRAFFKYVWIAK